VILDLGKYGAKWRTSPDLSAEVAVSSDSLGSSHSLLHCSRTVSSPCSSHFTEAADPLETIDEPVESRELDDTTDTGLMDFLTVSSFVFLFSFTVPSFHSSLFVFHPHSQPSTFPRPFLKQLEEGSPLAEPNYPSLLESPLNESHEPRSSQAYLPSAVD
jgi:hypothetical protein